MMPLGDPRKLLCGLCGHLFHEPDMAAVPNYDYRRTSVSDVHRLMFHAGTQWDLNYDPEYLAASSRFEQARQRRHEAYVTAVRNNEPFSSDTPGPKIERREVLFRYPAYAKLVRKVRPSAVGRP